ncbi:(d)CMP kinase [Granulosicoccaceae sp. 1_MG-2023]|nr:(d)CMP kinase [Granulosicoccaceae sp. 1_MG-2023]
MTELAAPVITIDGPSGAGKGTVAQRVAETLGFALLDSGALYRLSALAVLRHGADPADGEAVAALAAAMQIRFEAEPGQGVRTWLDGEDVSQALRNEETAAMASKVAVLPQLRRQLLDVQRGFARAPGLVADGRDMGTVVFPDAPVKIFLTASAQVRAERRLKQLKEKGIDANLPSLLEDISQRDARDSERKTAPLKPAADAVTIDSSALNIDQVCQQVLEIAEKNGIRRGESES